jgi:hypothetical protein
LKTLFHIQADEQPNEAQTLLIEAGPDYCCYAFLNKTNNTITHLKYFSVDEFEMEMNLQSIISELREHSFTEVLVCTAYPAALLTPFKYALHSDSLLNVVCDQPAQQHLSDTVNEWQLVNAYSVPKGVFEIIKGEFPSAQFIHTYTPAIKIYNGFAAEDQISIHFTTHYFRVLVKKGTQIQMAPIYSYKTPLDVAYYLLKICSELELSQSDVHLILSGLVEEASSLYKELHNYFLNIHFAQVPAVSIVKNEYPQHFFTSTYNLAACVS